MQNPFTLEGKRILVTGASSGIGRATAIAISKLGATLIITGRSVEKLTDTMSRLEGTGHEQLAVDLEQSDSIGRLTGACSNLNGVVHSAGIIKTLPFKFSSAAELTNIMKLNFEVPFLLTKELIRNKSIAPGGSIVFVSSLSGSGMVAKGISMYSASKGAINASAQVMALELAPQKIRVNLVSPGMVKTDMNSQNESVSAEQLLEDEKRNYPLGYGEPADVAHAVIYLLSDAARWVTGSNLVLDGGASIF